MRAGTAKTPASGARHVIGAVAASVTGVMLTTDPIMMRATGGIFASALQPDGKMVIGGSFTAYNGAGGDRRHARRQQP